MLSTKSCLTRFILATFGGVACFPALAAAPADSSGDGQPLEPELAVLVAAFQAQDAGSSFDFVRGEVNRFRTMPRSVMPAYARGVLQQLGLSTMVSEQELIAVTSERRSLLDLDADLSRALPFFEEETSQGQSTVAGESDDLDDGDATGATVACRVHAAPKIPDLSRAPMESPSEETIALERQAAKRILVGFLQRHDDLFRVGSTSLVQGLPSLELQRYYSGRYFRTAIFSQTIGGEPLLGGEVGVLFDRNWNVMLISRQIATPEKLGPLLSASVTESEAKLRAAQIAEERTGVASSQWETVRARLGIDPVNAIRAWELGLHVPGSPDDSVTVRLDAIDASPLRFNDNVDHEEAQVNRWKYRGGWLTRPVQVTEGVYTRDDNTLDHPYFHLVSDERATSGSGGPGTCTKTAPQTSSYRDAYGTLSGSDEIRPTQRSDLDFSGWSPAARAGTFMESHSYFWTRSFFGWMSDTLVDAGVIVGSPTEDQRVLIVANACSDYNLHSASAKVSTKNDEGEGLPVVKLQEQCRSGISDLGCAGDGDSAYDPKGSGSWVTCEGDGCHNTPSTLHHELNHFILKSYFDTGSGLSCSDDEELKYVHEGILGSVVPQVFWARYYGLGYSPRPDRLYKAGIVSGLIHVGASSRLKLSDYPCNDDTVVVSPYQAGRVAGQALWKIYHGTKVDGGARSDMGRPATDTDFLLLSFWSAQLTGLSFKKDRYGYADSFMFFADAFSDASDAVLGDWCEEWRDNGLHRRFKAAYCP